MPRASPSAKRQLGAASHRNIQHENGFLDLGRRPGKHAHQHQHKISSAALADSPMRSIPPDNTTCTDPRLLVQSPSQLSSIASGTSTDLITDIGTMAVPQENCHSGESGSTGAARRPNGDRRSSLDNASSVSSDSFGANPNPIMTMAVTTSVNNTLPTQTLFDESHRRIDVNAAKNANVHRDTGPIKLAVTVLRSCPLYDTLAILIILMHLSPVALSSIYMLFTVLTFVPPVTTSSGLSITEIFEGTLGTPALTTVACMDVGFLLVWLFLWGPLQQLILDFAQIVIALTLGGGGSSGSSRQGSANNIFVCVSIVFFSHFGHTPVLEKLAHLGPLFTASHSSAAAESPASFQPTAKLFGRRGGGVSWLRNIFAIHILTQGIVRYIREWYLRREKRDAMAQNTADLEAEKTIFSTDAPADSFSVSETAASSAGAGSGSGNSNSNSGISNNTSVSFNASNTNSANSARNSTGNGIGNSIGTGNNSIDAINHHMATALAQADNISSNNNSIASANVATASAVTGSNWPSGSLSTGTTVAANSAAAAAANTGSGFTHINSGIVSVAAGPVSAKKKKKQSALVRLRQPLWAALASTKIVMIKEYELSQAALESAGAEATEVDNLGNAPFYTQPCQIWICYVGHDEVCFSTSIFPDDKVGQGLSAPSSSYVDASKPFFVRINNATWQPTRIMAISDSDDDATPNLTGDAGSSPPSTGSRWTGDIYGLTPLSSYECEFVSTHDGTILFSTSVRTAPAPSRSADVAAAKSAPPSQPRPHESPATTIKASIAAQESKLHEERTRLKALRKDNNRRVNALKKEIDRLTLSVQSAGGNDEKLKQKITQNTVQQKQAEQAIESLEAELREVSVVPEDLLSRHRSKKSEWDRERALFDGAVASFKSFKSAVDSEIRALEEEQGSLQAKKNKIAARISKAGSDHARIINANSQGLDEVERRKQERASIESDILQASRNYTDRIAAIQSSNEEKVLAIDAMHEAMRSFYSSFDSERPYEDRHLPVPPLPAATPGSIPSAAQGTWPSHPTGAVYALGSLWPTIPGLPISGQSPNPASIAPVPPYMQMSAPHAGGYTQLPKMRGRSSSMLSDVSGFTQSSVAEEDAMAPVSTCSPEANTSSFTAIHSIQLPLATTLREQRLSIEASRLNSSSGSGSGSGSSDRSESESVGSVHDLVNPL